MFLNLILIENFDIGPVTEMFIICVDTKDDEEAEAEDSKEMASMPGYEMLSEREKRVS